MTSSTSSEAFSTSTPSSNQRSRTTKATFLLITLTLACCLLASSSSSTLVSAAPTPRIRQHQQRSLAHQVHHVQIADESVHNTMVLLKKSIQKRKIHQQKKRQQSQKAHTASAKVANAALNTESKKLKRRSKRDIADFVPASDDRSLPYIENNGDRSNARAWTNQNNAAARPEGVTHVDNHSPIDAVTIQPHVSSLTDKNSKHRQGRNGSTPQKKRKYHQRERLLSAYESIIFSESQIPVFLTQDQHHHAHSLTKKQRLLRTQIHRQFKGAVRVSENKKNPHPQRQYSSSTDHVANDDKSVAQAEDTQSLSSLPSDIDLDIGQDMVAQDTAENISANNNLQNDHVDEEEEETTVGANEEDDKNSSLLGEPSSNSAFTTVLPAEDNSELSMEEQEGDESEPIADPSLVTVVILESQVSPAEAIVNSIDGIDENEDGGSSATQEIEDGWIVLAASDDNTSDNNNNINNSGHSDLSYPSSPSSSPSTVEFQSPESNDIPITPSQDYSHSERPIPLISKTLFHSGCSMSSTAGTLGFFLIVIGFVYRFYIRKQIQKKQRRPALPLDTKSTPD
ncbi:hypothetical protein FBU30_007221, partial [Linnemannia zychae]